jgi:putative transposase
MSYTTDLSDRQFKLVEKYLPVKNITRPRKYELKDLINGMLYVLKTGCQWRLLPDRYPPYRLVHSYFRKLVLDKYLDNMLFE